MADFLPWFPLDFEAFKTGTRGWTAEERWAYLELLWVQWEQGGIPNEPQRLHLYTEGLTRTRFMRMWRERIAAKFVEGEGGLLVNPRMAGERELEVVKVAQARSAGLASAKSRRRNRATDAATDAAAEGPAGATAVAAPLTETAAQNQRPLNTSDSVTGTYSEKTPPARERETGTRDSWGLAAFETCWRDELKRAPADRHKEGRDRWRDLVERIEADAGLLQPPLAPKAYAELLMRALPAYADHADRTGQKVPSISVAAFEGWYATLAAWVERTRPRVRRGASGERREEAPPPPTEAELEETLETMRRLGLSGRHLAPSEPPSF